MDYLKHKMRHWSFLDGCDFKVQTCASKHQRVLIKKMYRSLKRGAKNRAKRDICNVLLNES